MEIVQLNLNHCEEVQDMLGQLLIEEKGDVAMLSEPYRCPSGVNNWVSDSTATAAIWASGRFPIQQIISRHGEGYVIAVINKITFCSCYAPPRWDLEKFEKMLKRISDEVYDVNPIIISGDFNAWATEWGSKSTNARGNAVLEHFSRLNLALVNVGFCPTFVRNSRTSIIDLTFCSPALASSMNWRVSNAYTLSDHRVIRYTAGSKCHRVAQGSGFPAWKTQCFNEELFIEALRFGDFPNTSSALKLAPAIANACDTSMPRKKGRPYPRRRAYWWTTEIAQCRSHCVEARRKMNRAKSSEQREDLRRLYILARSNLKRKIKASKRRCFLALCDEVVNNSFGAYRTLMGKMVGQDLPRERNPTVLKSIIEQLFPNHELQTPRDIPRNPDVEPVSISADEQQKAAYHLKLGKAPGPDGIPIEAIKAAIKAYPEAFLSVFQNCFDTGFFSDTLEATKTRSSTKAWEAPRRRISTKAFRIDRQFCQDTRNPNTQPISCLYERRTRTVGQTVRL